MKTFEVFGLTKKDKPKLVLHSCNNPDEVGKSRPKFYSFFNVCHA
jgi:hypothetical protein